MDADKSLSSLPDNGHHGTHMAMIQDPRGASNNGGRVHSLKFNSPRNKVETPTLWRETNGFRRLAISAGGR